MTTITNIHTGLSDWNAYVPYTVGTRCRSGSDAYEVISGGTSGISTLQGTGSSINDGSVRWRWLSSIDYTSVKLWANSIPPTLNQNIVGLIWNNTRPLVTTDQVPFFTVGTFGLPRNVGSYTITLTCAAGESFRDNSGTNTLRANAANGVCFQLPSSGTGGINYIDIFDSNVIFDGLQFIDPYSNSNSTIINVNASTQFTLRNCIIDGYGQDGGAAMIATQAMLMTNCLVVDRAAGNADGVAVQIGPSSKIVNNTFIRVNTMTAQVDSFAVLSDTTNLVRNCAFFGYLNPVAGSAANTLVEYCVIDTTNVGIAIDNGNNTFSVSRSTEFVTILNNYRLKFGAVSATGGKTDLTNIPLANDIYGYGRPQGGSATWSRGATELSSQFTAKVLIGKIAVVGTVISANYAASARSIGAISSLITAQQRILSSAQVTLGPITANAASGQSNITTMSRSIGTIALVANILKAANNLGGSATIVPRGLGTIASSTNLFGTGSLGPLALVSAASPVQALAGAISILPSASATTSFSTNLSATLNLAIASSSQISQTIVNASALMTIPITFLGSALQYSNLSATVSIGAITPLASALQVSLVSAASSLAVSANGNLRQEAYASALRTVAFTLSATLGQSNPAQMQATIGPLKLASAANLAYIVTAAINVGAIAASGTSIQSNQLNTAKPIGAIGVLGVMTNPIPVTGNASIGLTSLATIGFVNAMSAAATIGPLAVVASSDLVLSGQASLLISAVGIATNPNPLTTNASIGTITTFNAVVTNLAAIPVTATITLPAVATAGIAAQYVFSTALISLVISVRSTVASGPRLRVSQLPIGILTAGGAMRVSQTAIEVLAGGSAVRVSQTAIEVLTQSAPPSAGRVTQVISEVLANGTPRALAAQVVQEVLTGGTALQNVRMTQVLTEVLVGGATTQNIIISQVVMETLISAVPLKAISTTYVAV